MKFASQKNLSVLQTKSLQYDREYCQYLVVDARDVISATPPTKSKEAECSADDYPEDVIAFASYHIHGAVSPDGSYELPSYIDALGDAEEGVDSYVSTPRGRLWFIDSRAKIISVICDLACLPEDRTFIEYHDEVPDPQYSDEELCALEDDDWPSSLTAYLRIFCSNGKSAPISGPCDMPVKALRNGMNKPFPLRPVACLTSAVQAPQVVESKGPSGSIAIACATNS
jgi:hypothetical protein